MDASKAHLSSSSTQEQLMDSVSSLSFLLRHLQLPSKRLQRSVAEAEGSITYSVELTSTLMLMGFIEQLLTKDQDLHTWCHVARQVS